MEILPFICPSLVVEFLEHLLSDPQTLRFEHGHWESDSYHLHITLTASQPTASCPVCGGLSRRIHSRYERTLQDLTLAQWRTTLQLKVREFFCIHSTCPRRIFTERLPQVTAPWARRTCRLTALPFPLLNACEHCSPYKILFISLSL